MLSNNVKFTDIQEIYIAAPKIEILTINDIPIQVSYCDDFPAHVVVESVDTVGVDEAVSHPHTGLHHLINLSNHIKCFLDPVLTDLFLVALGFFYSL